MPGTVLPPVVVDTLPFTVSTKFSKKHTVDNNANHYADGSCQRNTLVLSGRRQWSIAKRLSIANIAVFRDFWLAHRAAPFYFYDPHETDPPFSHAPSGIAGRYTVRFNSDWEETAGMARSDASIELIEVASATDIADASDSSGNNPFVLTPVSYTLSVTTAWTADFDHASHGVISPFGISFAFGRLPLLSSSTSWAKRTDSFQLASIVDAGLLPLTTEFGIRGLQVSFFSDTYPTSGTNVGQQRAHFSIYDASLSVVYTDGTVRTFRPSTASLQDNGTALLTNGANAVDGDANTFADLEAPSISGILWTLASPSPLVLTDFR